MKSEERKIGLIQDEVLLMGMRNTGDDEEIGEHRKGGKILRSCCYIRPINLECKSIQSKIEFKIIIVYIY